MPLSAIRWSRKVSSKSWDAWWTIAAAPEFADGCSKQLGQSQKNLSYLSHKYEILVEIWLHLLRGPLLSYTNMSAQAVIVDSHVYLIIGISIKGAHAHSISKQQPSQASSTFVQSLYATQNGDCTEHPHFLHHDPPSGQSAEPQYFRLLIVHSLAVQHPMTAAALWTLDQ